MLTSKSTKGCRLSANAPVVMRAVEQTGLTTGRIDPSACYGKSPKVTKPKPTKRSGKRRSKTHKLTRKG